MTEIRSFLLENTIQHYEWGTRGAEAFIPNFLGFTAEPDRPYAELWIGAHPSAPSRVRKNSERLVLPDFISQAPVEILGRSAAEQFSSELPFLLKVLSAGAPLSIQAHPDRLQARELHARDAAHYPDSNHKPEIAVALTHLTALAGFKPFDELLATLGRYPSIARLAGDDHAARLLSLAREEGTDRELRTRERRQALKAFFSALMRRALTHTAELEASIMAIEETMRRTSDASEEAAVFLNARSIYGCDVGLISMLLLNLVHLKKGEGIFLGPGIPHAYLEGAIVECMANSDNVVRAGLTPKFKDVETLCTILTYDCGRPVIMPPVPGAGVTVYPAPVEEFVLSRTLMTESDTFVRDARRTLEIMLVVDGSVSVTQDTGRQLFSRGDAVLIPAVVARYELAAHTDAELFFASIPI